MKCQLQVLKLKVLILLAGLHCDEETGVIENEQTRNHTEKMLGLKVIEEGNMENNLFFIFKKNIIRIATEYFVPGIFQLQLFYCFATL